jgi:hypothetical protein
VAHRVVRAFAAALDAELANHARAVETEARSLAHRNAAAGRFWSGATIREAVRICEAEAAEQSRIVVGALRSCVASLAPCEVVAAEGDIRAVALGALGRGVEAAFQAVRNRAQLARRSRPGERRGWDEKVVGIFENDVAEAASRALAVVEAEAVLLAHAAAVRANRTPEASNVSMVFHGPVGAASGSGPIQGVMQTNTAPTPEELARLAIGLAEMLRSSGREDLEPAARELEAGATEMGKGRAPGERFKAAVAQVEAVARGADAMSKLGQHLAPVAGALRAWLGA